MSAFDDIFEVYEAFKMVGKAGDKMAVDDSDTADIPAAEKISALVIRGKGGKRFLIDGLRYRRIK